MDLTEYCYSVLLVSAAVKFNDSLTALLPGDRYHPVTTVRDAASARRLLLEQQFDIAIVNTPLPDDFGSGLALDICNSS